MQVIENEVFRDIDQNLGGGGLSLNEKYQFLKKIPLFKHWENYALSNLAAVAQVNQ